MSDSLSLPHIKPLWTIVPILTFYSGRLKGAFVKYMTRWDTIQLTFLAGVAKLWFGTFLPPYPALFSRSICSAQPWVLSTSRERSDLLLLQQAYLRPVSSIHEHITRVQRNHPTHTPDYRQYVNSLICHPLHPKERREGAAECTRKWSVEASNHGDQREGSSKARCSGHYRLWTCWAYRCHLPCTCKPRACFVRRFHGQRFRCWWPTYYDY